MIYNFFYEEDGQTLVEYGFIIALIALVAISAVTLFGAKIKSALYDKAITKITN